MQQDLEGIKKWLKSQKKHYAWLADQFHITEGAVKNWFSKGRIPKAQFLFIQKLMVENQVPPYEIEGKENMGKLFITLDEKSQEAVLAECRRLNITLSAYCSLVVEWCATTPKGHAVIESIINGAPLPSVVMDLAPLVQSPANPHPEQSLSRDYAASIIGEIAAGSLFPGDTVPQAIRFSRPLGKGEYLLRVNGKSMEPVIPDGAVVIMRKHTIPPVPKVGTIVEYNDERGVTLKKLGRRKNPETGKLEYVLKPLNPEYKEIEPMDGGKISAVFVGTLKDWSKA
ncbi:S24 family peptidase [Akkermansia sp. Marseille-P9185]|uniref:S24 family peptidase n=1 Tax=Akkermansia massiliensis TaxID=2927224 RepID=UPI00209BC034|nr:S24 family peptidase [Akkermansia massiliensis]MCO8186572.1 S24 family peptidase [Akkermansia massiliensis]